MFKDCFTTIKDISNVILSLIITAIPILWDMNDKDPSRFKDSKVVLFLLENAIQIIIVSSLTIAGLIIVFYFVEINVEKKKWVRSVLQNIVDKYLYGKNYSTRVTVFKSTRGDKYLKCYARYGYPLNRCPSPRKIPLAKEGDRPIGVVGKCFSEADAVECHARSLEGVKFAAKLKNNKKNTQRIKTYMEQTYLPESHYDVLKNMNRKSTHFYAYPILSKDTNIWGVLIIDNNDDCDFNFSPVKEVIELYSKMISLTLKI